MSIIKFLCLGIGRYVTIVGKKDLQDNPLLAEDETTKRQLAICEVAIYGLGPSTPDTVRQILVSSFLHTFWLPRKDLVHSYYNFG